MNGKLLIWFAIACVPGAALPASAEAQSMGGALAQESRATIQISVSTMPRFEIENQSATDRANGPGALIALAPPKLKSNAPNLRYVTVIVPPDEPSEVRSAGITNDDLVPGSISAGSMTTAATGRRPLLVLIVPD